jgi:holo-[acyl-carrier protein] synthase
MEIIGIGSDIVECVRIGRMIERHGEMFLERVYTAREIRYCQSRKHVTEHFAGRWAAKEAVFKALGTRRARGLIHTLGVADILVSISHCRAYATAHALAVRAGPAERPAAP